MRSIHPHIKENTMSTLVKILVAIAIALGLGFLVRAIISHFDTPVQAS